MPHPPLRKQSSFSKLLQTRGALLLPSGKTNQPKEVRRTRSFIERLRSAASSSTGSSDLEIARRIFDNASVIHITNVQYQFFSTIKTNLLSGEIESVVARSSSLDHIVNRWERAENGENLPGYGRRGGASAAEAHQLNIDPKEYEKLPCEQKMQFAAMDYESDPDRLLQLGYGRSYFIISKKKCMEDGYIHYGDSSVDGFHRSRGAYRTFADRLESDSYSVRLLSQSLKPNETAPPWIEVNLKGGVALPEDIDKFVVDEQELYDMQKYLPVERAKAALNEIFPGKIEYK